MTKAKSGILLYRATRDGFAASNFHSNCDGKENTVTIIETKTNYVFGGYTAAKWHSNGYISDSNTYVFSLRKLGILTNLKYMVTSSTYAIYGGSSYGPTFGNHVLYINSNSNSNTGSYTQTSGYSYESDSSYMSGAFTSWLTSEIEVYQIFR